MRVYIAVFALCLIAAIMTSEPYSSAGKEQHSESPHASKNGMVAVQEQPQGARSDKQETNRNAPHWYTPLKRPEWVTVFVAVLALIVIAYQAYEMRRATEVMKRSIDLQGVPLRQWVNVEHWDSRPINLGQYLVVNHEVVECQESVSASVTFDVVNPTKLPLSFLAVHTLIRGQNTATVGRVLLPPDGKFHMSLSVTFKGTEVKSYIENSIVFALTGSVYFEDVFREKQVQTFSRIVAFNIHRTIFKAYEGTLPQPAEWPEEKENKKKQWWRFWAN